ncbi:MAG: hypothetical protein R3A51_21455, partial [Nannocystaceae bacterium]
HAGREPEKVELVKVWYQIPTPEQVLERGYYIPEIQLEKFGHEHVIHTTRCARDPEAQLPNWIRARHDLPLLPEGAEKPWLKHRARSWQRRHDQRARASKARAAQTN